MTLIHLLLTLLLIAVNLAAITRLASRWLPPAIAKAAGMLAVTLPLFTLEHLVGLGSLEWLWPIVTGLSLYVLWRGRARVLQRDFVLAEAAFWGVFTYALLWRFFVPNIDASSEHLANLYFIANYLPGERLPPPDLWLAGPYRFDFYYGFQHYVAALMARLLDLGPGLAMNLAQPLLIGFIGSLGAFAISCFVKPWVPRLLLVAALVAGGNGLAPILQFVLNPPAATPAEHTAKASTQFWAATRLSGVYEKQLNTREGIELFQTGSFNDPALKKMDLPYETVTFYSFLGDYHPPLGGFALLMLALAIMAWLMTAQGLAPSGSRAVGLAVLAATPVLCIVVNVWTLPLQGLLLLAFAGFLVFEHAKVATSIAGWREAALQDSKYFAAGGLLCLGLIYPFLVYFAPQSLSPAFMKVPPEAATRLSIWWGLHWPVLVLGGLALWVGRKLGWLWWLCGLVALILYVSEAFYFADGMGDTYLRFNTTIKWWSWLLPLAIVGLAAPVFGLGGKIAKGVVLFVAVALLSNLINVGRYFWHSDSPTFGKIAGDGWLRLDGVQGEMLSYLEAAPPGLVLENMNGGAYNNTSAFALFAGKPLLLGWPAHEVLWRRGAPGIWPLHDDIKRFYAGELPDALGFLMQRGVRYVLWTRWDEARHPGGSRRLDAAIGARYRFRAFESFGETRVGLWELQGPLDRTQSPIALPLSRPNSLQP